MAKKEYVLCKVYCGSCGTYLLEAMPGARVCCHRCGTWTAVKGLQAKVKNKREGDDPNV